MRKHPFVLWCACFFAVTVQSAFAQEVTFANRNIEDRVRFQAGVPAGEPITRANALTITELVDLPRLGIVDLSGMEALENLEVLEVWENGIRDLSPLASLVKLRVLDLHDNRIVDLEPLKDLVELTTLDLSINRIKDLSPLEGLTRLATINLDTNLIRDGSPLQRNNGIDALDTLSLAENDLNQNTLCIVVPALQSRAVLVVFDGECPGEISGSIVDARTLEPLDCAIVIAIGAPNVRGIGFAGRDGRYVIDDLPPGLYNLTAFSPFFTSSRQTGRIVSPEIDDVPFELRVVEGGDLIVGRVHDAVTGLALAGVEVLMLKSNGKVFDAAYSCATGHFQLIRPDLVLDELEFQYLAAGYEDASITLGVPGLDSLPDVSLERRRSFTGGIADTVFESETSSTPLAEARVIIKPVGGFIAAVEFIEFDGKFSIGNLAPGEYSVQISSSLFPGAAFRKRIDVEDKVVRFNTPVFLALPETKDTGCAGSAGGGVAPIPQGDVLVGALMIAGLFASSIGGRRRSMGGR